MIYLYIDMYALFYKYAKINELREDKTMKKILAGICAVLFVSTAVISVNSGMAVYDQADRDISGGESEQGSSENEPVEDGAFDEPEGEVSVDEPAGDVSVDDPEKQGLIQLTEPAWPLRIT